MATTSAGWRRVGAIQFLHAGLLLLLRAAGGHQQRAGGLRGGRRCHAQPACFRFGVAGVSVLALRWKEAAPGRVGAIQLLPASPLPPEATKQGNGAKAAT